MRGEEGFYHYRQYAATELAEKRSFEDVTQLMIDGALPDADGQARFAEEYRPLRDLSDPVARLVPAVAAGCPAPFPALRTMLSHVAGVEAIPAIVDADAATLRANVLRLQRGRADDRRGNPPRDHRATIRSHRATTSATPPTTCGC